MSLAILPAEAPEEEYDPRTLYERLQENKMKKEAEYEEAHKLKNMIRGLDSDEVAFLEHVDRAKMEEEDQKFDEEERAIADFKVAAARLSEEESAKKLSSSAKSFRRGGSDKPQSSTTASSKQANLLKQAVKRKEPDSDKEAAGGGDREAVKRQDTGGRMQCIGVLPGIGSYGHSDSSDSENSDSDSDLEVRGGGFMLIPKVCKSSGGD